MPRNRERWRALALTAVLLGHAAVILVVVRADRDRRMATPAAEPTARRLAWLQAPIQQPPPLPPARSRIPAGARTPLPLLPPVELPPSPTEVKPQTRIDWARAAELAAQSGTAELERQAGYRDLAALASALSPAQREWLKQQKLEPVPPGIRWAPSRVEVTPEGLPIIHVNEHCIVIPMLAFLMFCRVGHIEANGHLFDHMRDPREH